MRIVNRRMLLLGLVLAVAVPPLDGCGVYGEPEPSAIKFPGFARASVLRGDYLLCVNDANHIVAVDLKRAKAFDLGLADTKRWHDGDVADDQALTLDKGRLLVIALNDGKTVHEVPIGDAPVWAFGFAGRGRAFVHRGRSVAILELATHKTLHTIELGEGPYLELRRSSAWQKVGSRLFVTGPATTLCVIDLEAGKLCERFPVDSRAGIAALHVEGSQVYCIGSASTWAARIDHMTCFDLEMKKSFLFDLPREVRRSGRLASGAYGTVYLIDGNRLARFTMAGDQCGAFTAPGPEPVLAVWHQHALIAAKNEIRLLQIKETPVARK